MVGIFLSLIGSIAGCGQRGSSSESSISSDTTSVSQSQEMKESLLSTSATEEQLTNTSQTKEESNGQAMDLEQIQKGDYSSLIGEWEEVAIFFNRLDGQGSQWVAPREDELNITQTEVENQGVILSSSGLFAEDKENEVSYTAEMGYLAASSYAGTAIWTASFHPVGVDLMDFGIAAPENIDADSERIAIGTTHYIKVFKRNKASNQTNQVDTTTSSLDINEIERGNYASANGQWENSHGDTITIDNETILFSNITSTGESATINTLTVDIPDANGTDGKPVVEEGVGGIQAPRYDPHLRTSQIEGYVTLQTNYTNAQLCISFLPQVVEGNIQNGELDREKIVAVGTQNGPTVVPDDMVYYRID